MWILIVMMHVGPMGDGNSNALTTAEFTSEAKCKAAGKKAEGLASGTVKDIRFVCAEK